MYGHQFKPSLEQKRNHKLLGQGHEGALLYKAVAQRLQGEPFLHRFRRVRGRVIPFDVLPTKIPTGYVYRSLRLSNPAFDVPQGTIDLGLMLLPQGCVSRHNFHEDAILLQEGRGRSQRFLLNRLRRRGVQLRHEIVVK